MEKKLKESSESSNKIESKYDQFILILKRTHKFKMFPLVVGTVIAIILRLFGKFMPPVPGAVIIVVGIAIFIFGACYTIILSIVRSSKNLKKEYKAARGHDDDAY